MSPFKRAADDSGQDAARWKQKFLDALEEHEQREKSLQQRIGTLRRGLLGVSLAGDGLDDRLDRQLGQLRKLLRKSDHETGLEALLEQIESSVLRLDSGKQEEAAALNQALKLNIEHLRRLDLPGDHRQRIQRFAREHGKRRTPDAETLQHDVAEFMALLRALVDDVLADARRSAAGATAPRRGLWSRLFGGEPPSGPAETPPATESPQGGDEDVRETPPEPDSGSAPGQSEPADRPDMELAPEPEPEPEFEQEPEQEPEQEQENEHEPKVARLTPRHLQHSDDYRERSADAEDSEYGEEADGSVHGELLRGDAAGGSGLAEPGFSYIADHVEPLLLRILENIHVAEQSLKLAESIRETVQRGLNWYDFVAVLEDLVTIISQSRDEEREEFQGFLQQLNDNLQEVQTALVNSEQAREKVRAAGQAMDDTVRGRLDEISRDVEQSQDIDQLKQSVSGRIETIIGALDDYRREQDTEQPGLERELRMLSQRVTSMEDESRTLREYLTLQQENALRDKLTGLHNRDAYDRRIREECDSKRQAAGHEQRAGDRDLCLAVCDVDHFKPVNDRFGHLAGDRVLKVLARELESRVRDTDFVARYGGEEFVVILPDTWLDDALDVLDKLRSAVEQMPFHFRDDNVPVTVSFGVTAWQPGDTPDRMFERADKALYRAKQQGRNCCEVDRGE